MHGHYSFPVHGREAALRVADGNGDIRGSVDRLGDMDGPEQAGDVRCPCGPCATKKVGASEKQGKPLHYTTKRN